MPVPAARARACRRPALSAMFLRGARTMHKLDQSTLLGDLSLASKREKVISKRLHQGRPCRSGPRERTRHQRDRVSCREYGEVHLRREGNFPLFSLKVGVQDRGPCTLRWCA